MKVLVTGGRIPLGLAVAQELTGEHQVYLLDTEPVETEFEFIRCDLLNLDEIQRAVKGMDAIIHLAELPDDVSIPNSKMLGVVSPEIVGALERVLPEEDRTGYRNRLEKQLHPLRESFLVSMFAGGKIMTLNKQLPMLFLSLREILPTNGLRFRNEFLEQARIFGADLNDKSAS